MTSSSSLYLFTQSNFKAEIKLLTMSDFFVIPTFYLLFVVIRDGGGGGRDGGLSEATVPLTCLVIRDN